MLPERPERHPRRQGGLDRGRRRRGEHDLPAVTGGPDTSRAVHVGPDIQPLGIEHVPVTAEQHGGLYDDERHEQGVEHTER